jgi:prenylcysteine alpha-carboxyl methylesterase
MSCCWCHLQGSALEMLEDVNTGIAWVLRKVERYGGNPDQVWLVGQSAGGQLAMLALLSQAAQVGSRHSWQLYANCLQSVAPVGDPAAAASL